MRAATQFRLECQISGAEGSEDRETPYSGRGKNEFALRALCVLLTAKPFLWPIALIFIKKYFFIL